jgi:hypothetical protein
VPCLCLLGATECDENETLRGSSVETSDLIGSNNEATACGGDDRGGFVDYARLVGVSVVYFSDSDDNISGRLRLGMETLDGRGTDSDTCEQG